MSEKNSEERKFEIFLGKVKKEDSNFSSIKNVIKISLSFTRSQLSLKIKR